MISDAFAALTRPDPCAVVVFGASGDLAHRKIFPALYRLHASGVLPDRYAVIGYSRTAMEDDEFRELVRKSVAARWPDLDDGSYEEYAKHLKYVPGDVTHEGALSHLVSELGSVDASHGCQGRRLFYCATPPKIFPMIVDRLEEEGLNRSSRIVVEKPFGVGLEDARQLNRRLRKAFREDQIFRIDHYLGKETVQNVLVTRFANGIFEPLWNRRHIQYVQIDVAESIGIEDRGRFYEPMGAMRDVAQNHLLQLLALLAMEPPVTLDSEAIRDEKSKLIRSVVPLSPSNVVTGQYIAGEVDGVPVPGYKEEPDVASDSNTETFVAFKLQIDNWRWAGVPFYLRTGKRLAEAETTATIVFHDAPYKMFRESGLEPPDPNHLTIRFQPDEGISLTFDAKVPGPQMQVVPVAMDFAYEESFMTAPAEAYERLLHDVMMGDRTLFMRADEIERAWEVMEPVLNRKNPEPYAAGSWGPPSADDLIKPYRWRHR